MPIHDWTRVDAAIFHDFHHSWLSSLKHCIATHLPSEDLYALIERPGNNDSDVAYTASSFAEKTEAEIYAAKANRIVVQQLPDHAAVAVVEIVCPGHTRYREQFEIFVDRAVELLRAGINLLIIDPLPQALGCERTVHEAIWEKLGASDPTTPPDRRMTVSSYSCNAPMSAFVQPLVAGTSLPEMPLFLGADKWIMLPLESAYQSAWEAVPRIWRRKLEN